MLPALGAMLAAAVVLYAPVAAGVAQQWYADPASSHGILLIGAAGLVVWRRRTPFASAAPRPANWGFALLAAGLLLYLAGDLAGDLFAVRLSLPVVLAGAVAALFGVRHLQLALAPLALLALAIPLPQVVVTNMTLPLQLAASQVGAGLLQTAGVEVVRQGNLLAMPHITLEVADVCSGLRSLVSLVSVAAMVGAVLELPARRTIFLMTAAVPIAVLGNGVRVATTGLMTTWIGESAVRGIIHDMTGVAAFAAMCAAIVVLLRATRSRRPLVVADSW